MNIARNDFLARRMHGLGGSDIAAIVGLSKFKTPYDVWLSKQPGAPIEDERDKPWLYWGAVLEDMVAKEYALRTGAKIQRVNAQLVHPDHHFALANIDRAVVNPEIRGNVRWLDGRLTTDRILECKTANGFAASVWGADGTDQVPDAYLCQTQWYMGITGARYADLAVLIGGSDYRRFTIEVDAELFADLLTEAAAFWRLVEAGIAPDPQTVADAQNRWPQHLKAKTTMATAGAARAVQELADIKERMADLKEREDALKLTIMAEMQDAETLTDMGDPIATWKAQTAERIDSKALRADHPDIAALYSKTSTTRVLRLKSKKD